MSGQRVLISRTGDATELVVQIGVPATDQDYGVLLPVPAEPVVDAVPVDSDELDQLDAATRVTIHRTTFVADGGGGGGCGCGDADATRAGGGMDDTRGVTVSAPVTVGPVTAVSITADTGAAITAWLDDNGFLIPPEHQPVVDSYAGPGRYFVAFKRSEGAPMSEASSVGVHITLPGDHPGYALRISKMGAAEELAVIVFVAADGGVGPSPPFVGLTVGDLDPTTVDIQGYTRAVADAIADNDNLAFVVEGAHERDVLVASGALGPQLSALTAPGQRITRMAAVFATSALDRDASLGGPPPPGVTSDVYLTAPPGGRPPLDGWPWLVGLLVVASVGAARRHARRAAAIPRLVTG
jgi:hypothetical protein